MESKNSNEKSVARGIRKASQPVIIVEKNKNRWLVMARNIFDCFGIKTGDGVEFTAQEGVAILRNIVSEFSLKPIAGDTRILVIFAAEELSSEEANTLLKILEEPPRYGRIFLFTRNPSKILVTIRSRCAQLASSSELAPNLGENIFKAQGFNGFLKSIAGLENDEILDILENTLIDMRSKLTRKKDLAFYKKIAISYIKAKNTNVNRKLLLEQLYLDKKAREST